MNVLCGQGNFVRLIVSFCAVIALAAWLGAQYAMPQPGGQINPQINTELYGNGAANSIKYTNTTSVAMASEVRNAYWKSGALPSDIRVGYSSIGPLAPGGAMAYIPSAQSYLTKPQAPMPSAMPASTYSTGASIRYSAPAGGAAPVRSNQVANGPVNAGPINNSVRYSR